MIALGCDHGGFPLMKEVIAYLDANNIPYKNFGTFSEESVDYPVYGKLVAHAVADGECETKSKASVQHCAAMCSPQKQPENITMPTFWQWALV